MHPQIVAFRLILGFLVSLGLVTQMPALDGQKEANTAELEAAVYEVPAYVPPTYATTTTIKAVADNCDDVVRIALSVGWPASELAQLKRVAFRESRCTNAHNTLDPGPYGSIGVMQVNSFWCSPSKYWPAGYLQAHGIVRACGDLFNATINMRAALAIWQYAHDKHGDGWGPWVATRD